MNTNLLLTNLNAIWIMIFLIAILTISSIGIFLFFRSKTESEIRAFAKEKNDEENQKLEKKCEHVTENIPHCHFEGKAKAEADTMINENEKIESRYNEHNVTRIILIKMLNDSGVKGVSKLKKEDLLIKVKESNLEYPIKPD